MFSEKQRIDYLLNVYFGDYLAHPILSAVNTAYLDFARTQHGFGKKTNKNEIHSERVSYLVERISYICNNKFDNQKDFDDYHKETTEKLVKISQKDFTVGQGQKWINMSLKYCLIIDPRNYSINSRYFHIPIDNIVLGILKGFPSVGKWSRIRNYDHYLKFQKWFRKEYADKEPIMSELEIWKRE